MWDRYIDLRPLQAAARELRMRTWMGVLLGVALIGWGIAVLLWPELLVALGAALLISAGIIVLLIAWETWSIQRRYERMTDSLLPPRRVTRIAVRPARTLRLRRWFRRS